MDKLLRALEATGSATITGQGKRLGKAISTVELVTRRESGLHQYNCLRAVDVASADSDPSPRRDPLIVIRLERTALDCIPEGFTYQPPAADAHLAAVRSSAAASGEL